MGFGLASTSLWQLMPWQSFVVQRRRNRNVGQPLANGLVCFDNRCFLVLLPLLLSGIAEEQLWRYEYSSELFLQSSS